MTVVMTWPLARSPGDFVPGDLGDPLLTTLILWWNAHQLPFTASWWNGTFFFPGTESLALSDHRVGLGVFATPLIRAGASPLTAYGVTFLLTWWLSAAAAYALVWTLSANRAAAFVGGLIFGFNPFRAGHLPHLELLAAYCLPVILLALHQWLATRRRIWLIAMSAALLLQGLTSGYYLFFMLILVTLWLIWFARGLAREDYAALAAAIVIPIAAISPVLIHYRQVHDAMGLSRSAEEIQQFSADLTGWLTAPRPIALWRAPAAWHRPEGELMPGLVAVLLVAGAALTARRQVIAAQLPAAVTWLRWALLAVTLTEIVVAALPWFVGPVAFTLAGIDVSMSGLDKPLSVAFVCAIAWLLTSRRFVAAFRARSMLVFYGAAAAMMFVLALGPEGRLMGRAVLYKAPYSWLMLLPGFDDSFRAPARFAMLGVLALGVAAALAFVRLTAGRSRRQRAIAAATVALAIAAESWIYPFPLAPAPPAFILPSDVPESAAVLELPVGIYEDALAMFHTTMHRRRTVNGISGYVPAHYQLLSHLLKEGNTDVLAVIRRYADLVVVRHRQGHDPSIILLEKQAAPSQAVWPRLESVRPVAIDAHPTGSSSRAVSDDDYRTAWSTGRPQAGIETLTLTLHEPRVVAGVELAHGPYFGAFARHIEIEVSEDGQQWKPVSSVDGSIAVLEGALRDPKRVPVSIEFEPQRARHIRIRQTARSRAVWVVAEVRVLVRPVE